MLSRHRKVIRRLIYYCANSAPRIRVNIIKLLVTQFAITLVIVLIETERGGGYYESFERWRSHDLRLLPPPTGSQ